MHRFLVRKYFAFENNALFDSSLIYWTRFIVYEGDIQVLKDKRAAHILQTKKAKQQNGTEYDSDEEEHLYTPKKEMTFISIENELKMWSHLHQQAKQALADYPTTIEEDEAMLAKHTQENILTLNQKHMLIFRLGEKKVYASHIDFTTSIINLFGMSLKDARKHVEKN